MPYISNFWMGKYLTVPKGNRPRGTLAFGKIQEVHVYCKYLDLEPAIEYARTLLINLQPGIENDLPRVLVEIIESDWTEEHALAALAFHNPDFTHFTVHGPQVFDARIQGLYSEGWIIYLV